MCKRVLIVDDDASFVFSLMNLAVNQDCALSLAESLGRARMMLKNNHYDVVVANSKVPGGSSYVLKDEIEPETKMLFMSSMNGDYEELLKKGENCMKKYELYQKFEAICG